MLQARMASTMLLVATLLTVFCLLQVRADCSLWIALVLIMTASMLASTETRDLLDECESGDEGKYPFLNSIVDDDQQWSDIGEQSFANRVRVKRDPTTWGDALQGDEQATDDRAKVQYDQPAHKDPVEYEYDVAQAYQHENIPQFHIESGRPASKHNTGTKSARKCLPAKLAYHTKLEATMMQRTPQLKPILRSMPLPKLPQMQEPIPQPQPLIPQSEQSISQPEQQPYIAQPEPKQYMAKPEPVLYIPQLESVRSIAQRQPVQAIPQPEPVQSAPQPEPGQYIPQSHAQQHIPQSHAEQHIPRSHPEEPMADQTLPQPQQLIPLSQSLPNPKTVLHTFEEPLQQITFPRQFWRQSEGALEQLVLPPLDFTRPEEANEHSEDYLTGRLACDVVERILRHVQSAADTRHHVRPGLPARIRPHPRLEEARHTDVDQRLHSILEDTLRKLSSMAAVGDERRLPDSLGAFLSWLLLASRDSSHEPTTPRGYGEVASRVGLLERLLSHYEALRPREQAVVRAEHDVIARLYQRLTIYIRSLATTRVERQRPPRNFKMRHVWDEEPGRSRQSKMPQRV